MHTRSTPFKGEQTAVGNDGDGTAITSFGRARRVQEYVELQLDPFLSQQPLRPSFQKMSWVAFSTLTLLHFLRTAWHILVALLYYPFVPNPLPLQSSRSKTPITLALVLSETSSDPSEEESEAIIGSVVEAVRCCEAAGVKSLCIYDRYGAPNSLLFALVLII